jgi:hypothetical protein
VRPRLPSLLPFFVIAHGLSKIRQIQQKLTRSLLLVVVLLEFADSPEYLISLVEKRFVYRVEIEVFSVYLTVHYAVALL